VLQLITNGGNGVTTSSAAIIAAACIGVCSVVVALITVYIVRMRYAEVLSSGPGPSHSHHTPSCGMQAALRQPLDAVSRCNPSNPKCQTLNPTVHGRYNARRASRQEQRRQLNELKGLTPVKVQYHCIVLMQVRRGAGVAVGAAPPDEGAQGAHVDFKTRTMLRLFAAGTTRSRLHGGSSAAR